MLEHGGRLREASKRYGIAVDSWLDLSTGINPRGYPAPSIPVESWHRLPEEGDGLEEAAITHYRTKDILPVCGSQAAIQCLPRLREHSRVGVLFPGYMEHEHAWKTSGHEVTRMAKMEDNGFDVILLSNPNNPTGEEFSKERLMEIHENLSVKGGWLVVDEAFIEGSNAESLISPEMPEGLIVLRSFGKFFGLPGARVGFVAANGRILSPLRDLLGPWTIPGPSRIVAAKALEDKAWQSETRTEMALQGKRLERLLLDSGLPSEGCWLFRYVRMENAKDLHECLASKGILTRLLGEGLRFGLPGKEDEWDRLEKALIEVRS